MMNGKYLSDELEIFEATRKNSKSIKLLFHSLKTILPTSIESEHGSSGAGLFITKMKIQLNVHSIDHFINCIRVCF